MSYEYSSGAPEMALPNPYRVENIFRFLAGAIVLLGGVGCLFLGRSALSQSLASIGWVAVLLGLGLLVFGIAHVRVAMTQLRFFFGRGKPAGLAAELVERATGQGQGAAWLKSVIRENAIPFEEPRGAINGLLYSLVKPLITAPAEIQWLAQRHFQTGLTLLVVLLAFGLSVLSVGSAHDLAWIGLFFYAYAAFLLIRPLRRGAHAARGLRERELIALIVVAVLAPVLIQAVSRGLPDVRWLGLGQQAVVLLVCALIAVAVFFVAVIRQMIDPPTTSMACELGTVSMLASPNQLLDEIDRQLQRDWTAGIPNRRYARELPSIQGAAGAFHGEVLEETQPVPRDDLRGIDFVHAFSSYRFRWLAILSALGVAFTAAMTVATLWLAQRLADGTLDRGDWGSLGLIVGLASLAWYCLDAGHWLWARFDFVSRVTWVELDGNFQRSRAAIGGAVYGHARTEKELVSVNDMSLRVWVAELDTVTFGRDSVRRIVGLRGRPDLARTMSEYLIRFAHNQSAIDLPTSAQDLQKMATLAAINRGEEVATLAGMAGSTGRAPIMPPTPRLDNACHQCAQPAQGGRYCTHCGTALAVV